MLGRAPVRRERARPLRSQIVTGSFDKTAKLWDSETGQLLHTLRGHTTVSAG